MHSFSFINQGLRNEKSKLSKKIEVREKLVEARRKKNKKDFDTISKLRLELSKLRQLRNKMRRREYNRKAKHDKVLERRKKRRQFIQQQIELGKMDKSSLSLVYSRKKLPYERKQKPISKFQQHTEYPSSAVTTNLSYQQFSSAELFKEQPGALLPTPTVEYIIEHDGQIGPNRAMGETIVEVEDCYETVTIGDGVTDQETSAAVAGISNAGFQGIHQSTTENIPASPKEKLTYVALSDKHQYANMASQESNSRPVSAVQLHHSYQRHPVGPHNLSKAPTEGSQEQLDFIVKVSS